MISLEHKKTTTDELDKALENCGSVYLVDFSRIKVQHDVELRKALRKQGIYYRVAKNTLLTDPPATSPSASRQWSHVE